MKDNEFIYHVLNLMLDYVLEVGRCYNWMNRTNQPFLLECKQVVLLLFVCRNVSKLLWEFNNY